MVIYGNTISFGGGGGSNDTLPPLLDNFTAQRIEAGLVPPVSNAVAFKDIPDGSKIKLVKGNNISGTVTYGKTTDLNHRIVFDSNDWTKKEFRLENDSGHNNISVSDIDQWLNSTKASNWWRAGGERDLNTTPPDYSNEQGFLYQLGITDELLAQNFNDININATAKTKVGLPWTLSFAEEIPYTLFKDTTLYDFGGYAYLIGNMGNDIILYDKPQTTAPSQRTLYDVTAKIHPMMEPKPETKVALDADGSYYMFENQSGGVVLSANKMEESRAVDLAGAVWVYGDHAPKNANDGTRIELTRDEVIKPRTYTEIEKVTESKIFLAPSDGQYKFVGVAAGGRSGIARRETGATQNVSAGAGGSGGITVSLFNLKQGDSVTLTINRDVTISYGLDKAQATCGQDGGSSTISSGNAMSLGKPGMYGTATGGNLANINGERGEFGNNVAGDKATVSRGGEITYEKYLSRGGSSLSTHGEGEVSASDKGSAAFIAILQEDKSQKTPLTFSQTLATGKTISDLPSKTKVKLGRYGSKDLIWLTTKNNAQEQFLVLSPESTAVSPFAGMMLDNAEPTNPNSARKKNGNNRYIHSNLHQWLNSDKPANEWYTAQHEYDAPPDYANIRGFLYEWSDVEKNTLSNRQWKVTKAKLDGSGDETFFAKVVIPSMVELGYTTYDSSEFLDIFKTNDDRVCNDKNWWLRNPYTDYDDTNTLVYQYGSKYQYPVIQKHLVRPLVNIDPYTPVSETPDSDGCYTLILSKPIDPNAIVTKTVTWDTKKNFYARQFTYNSKKQYQTMLEGATAELLLGEVPLPVSNLTISENAGASPTLSWKNPTDKNYHETVVVQKEGSTPPRSTDDGIEVYRGNGESVTVKDLQSTVDYSFGVFTLSQHGNYGEPATISYRYDFPAEPTSYIEMEKIQNTTQWVAPEDGWFKIVAVAKSGDGGLGDEGYANGSAGAGGGSGGISVSVLSLNQGGALDITINRGVNIVDSTKTVNMQVSEGKAPSSGNISGTTLGGQGGTATGGNLENINGTSGGSVSQVFWHEYPEGGVAYGGGGGETRYESYTTKGGNGDNLKRESSGTGWAPPAGRTYGTNAYVVILRGNTNISSQQ